MPGVDAIADPAFRNPLGQVLFILIGLIFSSSNGVYGSRPELIQAGALMALIAPFLLFVVAQKFFVQGIVITGVEK